MKLFPSLHIREGIGNKKTETIPPACTPKILDGNRRKSLLRKMAGAAVALRTRWCNQPLGLFTLGAFLHF